MSPVTANSPPPAAPPITPGDRLGLTLCLAIIVHAVVVLGVTFSPEEETRPHYEPLEIILVQKQSKAPEKADYLAQANLEGGGDSDAKERPATPLPAVFPKPVAKVTAPPPQQEAPQAPPELPQKTEQATAPAPAPAPEVRQPEPQTEPPPKIEQIAVATPEPAPVTEAPPPVDKADRQHKTVPPEPAPAPSTEPQASKPVKKKAVKQRPTPSAAELMSNSLKMAALSAEIQRKLKARAERPRRKFISASTKEYIYASYMEAWRAKVERVGNLNYPAEAKQLGLTGSLILDVALRPNGGVDQITIRKSSGNKILDEAAIRIVNLAAPFAPFPDDIRKETDILHITRTWQFLHGERFR